MVVIADFMLEGSAIDPWWTGDRVLGVCAAWCVCRKANVVENACFLASAAEAHQRGEKREEHDQEGQDAKALRKMAIVTCLESVMNMKILEVEVVSLLFCLST